VAPRDTCCVFYPLVTEHGSPWIPKPGGYSIHCSGRSLLYRWPFCQRSCIGNSRLCFRPLAHGVGGIIVKPVPLAVCWGYPGSQVSWEQQVSTGILFPEFLPHYPYSIWPMASPLETGTWIGGPHVWWERGIRGQCTFCLQCTCWIKRHLKIVVIE
jgi:hypothetical protein